MICPNCHFDNPALHRFCGMCGSSLQNVSGEAAGQEMSQAGKPGGPAARRPFVVSTTSMADVTAQMLNTRVVLPAPTVGTTSHSGYATPLRPQPEGMVFHGEHIGESAPAPVDPEDEPLFASRPLATVHEFEPRRATTSQNSFSPREPANVTAHEMQPEVPAPQQNESFFQFDPPSQEHNVSGPSFLGLGDNSSPDYLLEDVKPPSHLRRNLVLVALVIFGVLGYLEWRASSRGESLNPADVLHLKMSKQKGQKGAEIVLPPPNTSSSSPVDTTGANGGSGKPNLIAEPNQSATQANGPATAAGPESATQESQSPKTTEAAKPSTPSTAPSEKNLAPGETQPSEQADARTGAPAAETSPKTVPQSDSTPAKKPAATKTPAPATAPAAPAVDNSLSVGNFELQKGIAAGPTEEGRNWLWKATAKGNGEAPVVLAQMYSQGKGVPKDCEQAVLLLNAAAKKANPRARSALGSMYATGQCVAQDRVRAYKWMSAALEANPGSEWLEKSRQTLLSQMTPAERQRAQAIR